MPEMRVDVDSGDAKYDEGKYGHIIRRHPVLLLPHESPIYITTKLHGMTSGAPTVAFIMEFAKEKLVVMAETSLKLFQLAACATYGAHGDATEGAMMGHMLEGMTDLGNSQRSTGGRTFKMELSCVVKCPKCHDDIPGSCRYCPWCGNKLP